MKKIYANIHENTLYYYFFSFLYLIISLVTKMRLCKPNELDTKKTTLCEKIILLTYYSYLFS